MKILTGNPIVMIFSSREWIPDLDYPFSLKVWVEQDVATKVNFPFLPFCEGVVKKEHKICLTDSDKKTRKDTFGCSYASITDAYEAEKQIFTDIKELFKVWSEQFKAVQGWLDVNLRYDSSDPEPEAEEEKIEN